MKTEMKLKNKANEQQSIAVMANARVTVVIKIDHIYKFREASTMGVCLWS